MRDQVFTLLVRLTEDLLTALGEVDVLRGVTLSPQAFAALLEYPRYGSAPAHTTSLRGVKELTLRTPYGEIKIIKQEEKE